MIDSRAMVDPDAKIASDVRVEPYAIIGKGVEIDSGTIIGSHAVIQENTKIGRNNRISMFAVLGGDPQHGGYQGETTYLEMGDDNIVREFCTIHRGTPQGNGVTRIGNKNFLMAYSHIAHDCVVGDGVVFANNAGLAGHVTVGDHAWIAAFSGVHQHVNIGAYCFLGRATLVGQDVPPYLLVTGVPGGPRGVNVTGLKRHGFSTETIRLLRQAFSIIYRQDLKLSDAILKVEEMSQETSELVPFVEAIKNSKRGITRK